MLKTLLIITLIPLLFDIQYLYATDIIANKSSQVTVLTSSEVRDIFTLKKMYWDNGLKIKVLLLPRSSFSTLSFSYEILNMPVSMYFDIVEASYSSGKMNTPIILEDENSMLINTTLHSGAIGYLYDGKSAVASSRDVRILRIKEDQK